MSTTVTVPATTFYSILARIEQMELTNSALKAEIRGLLGAPAPVATKPASAPAPAPALAVASPAVAVKAPPKKRGPTRWNRYVSYLTEILTAADPEYKKTSFAERVEQAKSLKEDPEEGMGPTNLAFEAWLAAHPVATESTDDSSSDSAATTATDGAKKRGRPKGTKLTEEQKAKAAATRAANKAAKAAAAAGTASAPAAEADSSDLTPFEVKGVTYYRLSTGHSWIEADDDMVYVGLYNEATQTFDKSVPDPTA